MALTEGAEVERLAEVGCPACDELAAVPVPDGDAELVVGRSVALSGDHAVAECARGRRFRVYYC